MKTSCLSARRFVRVFKVLVLAGFLTTGSLSAQGWFNGNWQYRVPVTVTNAGGELTNFQVQVNLGPSFDWANTLAGGADIRFTAGDGVTGIDFWIESWNSGTSASIWVEVPTVAASPATTTIYMYYDYALASSASNGFATFEFFDDFNSGVLDVGAGRRWEASGGTWSAQSDTQHDGTTGYVAEGIAGSAYRILESSFTGSDYVLEGWGKQTAGRTWGFGIRTTDVTHTYSLNLYEDLDGTNNMYLYSWNGGASIVRNLALGTINTNTWYKIKVKAYGSNFDVFFNDVFRFTESNSQWPSGAVALFIDNNQTARYNDVRVRKYAASEPSASLGAVQTPTILLSYTSTNVSCHGGSNGTINLTVSGGTQPYTFSWTGPSGYTSNLEDISGLVAGNYNVTVNDAASNQVGQSIEITEPDPLLVYSAVTVAPTCSAPATILISASGGTLPYTGTGSFSQGIGTTMYNVTDANGCPANISVTVARSVAWLDPAWQYRDSVEVSNPGGTTLTDFQVQVNLNSSFDFSRANADGSDIRFTSSDGTTVFPYWIETWSPSSGIATIWVKLNEISAAGTEIYMYYGNSAAAAASSGDNTFLFFDDFSSVASTPEPGYFAFGPASTIMQQETAWGEGSAPHTLSVVAAPSTGAYDPGTGPYPYYGYYGPQGSGYIGIAGSYDLLTWTRLPYNPPPNSGINNPLFINNGERWPSVYKDGSTYYMVHTMNYGAPSYLVYRTSTDGLSWTAPTTIIQDGTNNQNPSLFKDPVSGNYYLYWYRGESGWSIMYRTASTVAGLASASNVLLINSAVTLAAPQMMYYDGVYYLSTEILESVWKVRMYASASPQGPFTVLPGNPVLDDGSACLFQHLIDTKVYEYYCKQATNGTWTLDMRVVDPTTGRIMYEEGELNDTKWTADGGTWIVTSTTQQDGTQGFVLQGTTTERQLLRSGFSGSDYTVEAYGRQIGGRVWGLGVRAQDRRNTYTLSLYEDLDGSPLHNLHYYTWLNGNVPGDVYADLGVIDMNTWYKLKVKAHGNSFDLYFNDILQGTATDNTWATGAVGFFGETGTIGQFNDIRVRKYAAAEPVTSLRGTQYNGFQWTGEGGSSEWNNTSNWLSCALPQAASNVAIFDGPFDPIISGITVTCNNLVIEPSGSLTINADGGLTATGTITINSSAVNDGGSLINLSTSPLTVTYNRFLRPESTRGDRHFFSSPVSGLAIDDFRTANTFGNPAVTKASRLWIYDEFTGGWPEITNSTDDFIPGKGYNVDQATGSDGLLKFTGSVINSANIKATSPYANYNGNPRLTAFDYGDGNPDPLLWTTGRNWTTNYGGGGWNLLGNPFTSAMNATEFITENAGKFDPWYVALYIYDGRVGEENYKYVAPGVPGWEEDPYYEEGGRAGDVIQVGQGFFVLALYDQAEFNFTPEMQVHNSSVPILKSASAEDPWPGIRLNIKYGDENRHTTVVYGTEMSAGPDPGYDVGLLSEASALEIYTTLPANDNGINFVRQALPVTGSEQIKVPVGIDFEAGGEVTFSAVTVPIGSNRFWLEDRQSGVYTDLTTKSYTATLTAETYGTGRFFIISSVNTPTGIEPPKSNEGAVRIWTSDNKVILKGEIGEKAICEVFDINGQLILKRLLTDNELNTIDLPYSLRGVYLVRVIDGAKVTTRKIAVL